MSARDLAHDARRATPQAIVGALKTDRECAASQSPNWSALLLVVAALGATLAVPIFLGGEQALLGTLHLSAIGYVGLLGMMTASWIARALKLRMLLHRMDVRPGFAHVVQISLATDFGFLATPAGLGGYAASLYYMRRAGASTSVAAAVTAADQGLDIAFFALALPFVGLAFFGSGLPPALVYAALGTSAALLLLALGAWLARRRLHAWMSRFGSGNARWPKLSRALQSFTDFRSRLLTQMRNLVAAGPGFFFGVFAWTAVQWTTRYGVLWMVLSLLGYRLSLPLIVALQALVLHVAQWTGVPAGGGGAELGLSAVLATWVPTTTLATALLLWRMTTLYLSLAAGAVAIALLARRSVPAAHIASAPEVLS